MKTSLHWCATFVSLLAPLAAQATGQNCTTDPSSNVALVETQPELLTALHGAGVETIVCIRELLDRSDWGQERALKASQLAEKLLSDSSSPEKLVANLEDCERFRKKVDRVAEGRLMAASDKLKYLKTLSLSPRARSLVESLVSPKRESCGAGELGFRGGFILSLGVGLEFRSCRYTDGWVHWGLGGVASYGWGFGATLSAGNRPLHTAEDSDSRVTGRGEVNRYWNLLVLDHVSNYDWNKQQYQDDDSTSGRKGDHYQLGIGLGFFDQTEGTASINTPIWTDQTYLFDQYLGDAMCRNQLVTGPADRAVAGSQAATKPGSVPDLAPGAAAGATSGRE